MKTFEVNEELFNFIYQTFFNPGKKPEAFLGMFSDEKLNYKFFKEKPKEEKKMTRQEAIDKYTSVNFPYTPLSVSEASRIVLGLEALGLLKFEEEKKEKKYSEKMLEDIKECRVMYNGSIPFLEALEAKGYKITNG